MQPRYTAELWDSITHIFEGILAHPFLAGLTDGTLPRENFEHYAVQDALYLRDYARALSLVGVRAPDEETLRMFNEHSAGAITVEKSLHESFFKDLGLDEETVARTPMAPTTLAYTSFTIRTAATGEFHEGLCSVLPCYWIYAGVGKALAENGSPDPMYSKWISTYGGEDFQSLVRAVLEVTDETGKSLTPSQKASATEAFVTASRYEWMFWNMGWTLERWPV